MLNYTRISKYYSGVDGVKLAVDLYLPLTDEKVPAVMYAGRDHRRERFEEMKSMLNRLLEKHYALVLPDLRGIGASYGRSDGFHSRLEAQDMKALMETMAAEPWSDGSFGMLGGSNFGFIQDLTAAERPAPLKAVIPCDCHPDFYYQDYPNGASRHIDFLPGMGKEPPAVPVDEDENGRMLEQAKKEHETNLGFLGQYFANMHRDTVNPKLGYAPQREISIWERMDSIQYSDIKYYKNGAWYDPGVTGAILAHKVFDGKLLIGPWRHCEIYRCNKSEEEQLAHSGMIMNQPNGAFDWEEEYLRFFDYALKNVENGCFTEPPIRYYTRGESAGEEWKYAADFPLDSQRIASLYLDADRSGTIESCYDGRLSENKPAYTSEIRYKTDRSINLYGSVGTLDRHIEGRFAGESRKCLTFTTEVMQKPVEITGIPTLELDVTSDHRDGLFLAVLEEVYPDGRTCFLTEGMIRASHAGLGYHKAYRSMGLPYHPGLSSDLAVLYPEKPLHLDFIMEAMSRLIQAGSRLRLSVFCAEESYQQPEAVGEEDPIVGLHLGRSVLKLPVIAPDVTEFTGEITIGSERGKGTVWVFKRAVYIRLNGNWYQYPCVQVYPLDQHTVLYKTSLFDVKKKKNGRNVTVHAEGAAAFELTGCMPERKEFAVSRPWLHSYNPQHGRASRYEVTFPDQWVATVPVERCQEGFPDIGPYRTMDLMLNLKIPDTGLAPYPCIVGIHGHGGDYDCFETIGDDLLDAGFALASIDYRATPPNRWPSLLYDAKGAIRFLKAHAGEYGLDAKRFGVIGGSCGGHLSAYIAATNGDAATEGDIGGNTEYDSYISAAAVYYPWTDALKFGEDSYDLYPGRMDKVMNSDGEFAPPGYMIDFGGRGKGLAELKNHLGDPAYQDIVERAYAVSPVTQVTGRSAPSVIIHGIFDCGIQIPMQQSVRFFKALTREHVKALLLCNNEGLYGDDPEVQAAVVDFLKRRI